MSVDGSSSVSGAPAAAADLHRECFAGEAAAGGAAEGTEEVCWSGAGLGAPRCLSLFFQTEFQL